jgi:transcriptional regulator with XRE-family HTH domain
MWPFGYSLLVGPLDAFRRRLQELRVAAGHSQASLAARAGLTRGHVLRIEGGLREPGLAAIVALARALKVNPGVLFEPPTTRTKTSTKKT